MQNSIEPPARVAKELVSADHPGIFPDHQDSFYIIWTHFRDYLDTFQIARKLFRSSTLFLYYPDTFSRLTGHFKDHLETFQIIQTHLSRHFAYYMDTLYSIRTFSKLSGNSLANNKLVAKTFRIHKKNSGQHC